MEMRDEIIVFLVYGISIFTVFFLGKLLALPIKLLFKLALNSLIGAGILALLNLIGSGFAVAVPINVMTAAVAGVLGIPGVLMLILIAN